MTFDNWTLIWKVIIKNEISVTFHFFFNIMENIWDVTNVINVTQKKTVNHHLYWLRFSQLAYANKKEKKLL